MSDKPNEADETAKDLLKSLYKRVGKEVNSDDGGAVWGTLGLALLKATGKLAQIQAEIDTGDDEEMKKEQVKLRALPFQRSAEDIEKEGGFEFDSKEA